MDKFYSRKEVWLILLFKNTENNKDIIKFYQEFG